MATEFSIIDAFVGEVNGRTLRGNPAAVVFLDEPKTSDWLQSVAEQFNLSETAFLWAREDANQFDLRWFSPKCEVNLCGHATLAAAQFLAERGAEFPLHFSTRSGVLSAAYLEEDGEFALTFPRVQSEVCPLHPQLLSILGLSDARQPTALLHAGEDFLLKVAPGTVEKVTPNFERLGALLENEKRRGLIVTERAPNGASYNFTSRFFAPHIGIPEDPVTGSAHCALAPFWARGKSELIGFQNSPRGGLVRCFVDEQSVALCGKASTFAKGHLRHLNSL